MRSFGKKILSAVLRLLGGGGILLAALLLSHALCTYSRACLVQTEAYLSLLRLIRGQIACYNRSFAEICHRMDANLFAACGFRERDSSLSAMLGAADLRIEADAEHILVEFAGAFGHGYRTEQLAVCDGAIGALDAVAARLRQRLPEKLRLIRCCCFCGALALILLLY